MQAMESAYPKVIDIYNLETPAPEDTDVKEEHALEFRPGNQQPSARLRVKGSQVQESTVTTEERLLEQIQPPTFSSCASVEFQRGHSDSTLRLIDTGAVSRMGIHFQYRRPHCRSSPAMSEVQFSITKSNEAAAGKWNRVARRNLPMVSVRIPSPTFTATEGSVTSIGGKHMVAEANPLSILSPDHWDSTEVEDGEMQLHKRSARFNRDVELVHRWSADITKQAHKRVKVAAPIASTGECSTPVLDFGPFRVVVPLQIHESTLEAAASLLILSSDDGSNRLSSSSSSSQLPDRFAAQEGGGAANPATGSSQSSDHATSSSSDLRPSNKRRFRLMVDVLAGAPRVRDGDACQSSTGAA